MKDRWLNISLALVIVFSAVMATVGIAAAQGDSATLRFDPPTVGITPGAENSVSIIVENVSDLYALEFHLSFDPQVIQVVDADPAKEGIQIAYADTWMNGFVAVNNVDNATGKIDFAVTLLNPAEPLAGTQTVGTLTFLGMGNGTTAISIDSTILSTRDALQISVRRQNGTIGVNAQGQAPEAIASDQGDESGKTGISATMLAIAGGVVFLLAAVILVFALKRK